MLQSIKSLIEDKIQALMQVLPDHVRSHPGMLVFQQTQVLQNFQAMTQGGVGAAASAASVAPAEHGRIWGDPHFEGGDGDRYDVQGEAGKTYHLLSDTGLILNGSFAPYSPGKTVVGETGLTLSGPHGNSRIVVQSRPKPLVTLDGIPLRAGESAATADGGKLTLSADGRTLQIETREGYRIDQEIKNGTAGGELEIRVQTPKNGVGFDGFLPAGLLGQTFDADHAARRGTGDNGEGAITGNVGDYEVNGGIFDLPAPGIVTSPQNLSGLTTFFSEHGLKAAPKFPALNPLTCQTIDWAEEIRQETLDSLQRNSAREAKSQALSSNAQSNRLAHLLRLALASGNISLAMMIFSHLEARSANEVTRGLMEKVQKLQDRKRQFSQEIQNQKDDAEGSKNLQKIKADMEQANDDISVLQTFIKDVTQNKQQSQELANAFISKEHETTMSILRSWAR